MTRFPLPGDLASIHEDAIAHASAIQNKIAARGGCQSLSSEALNVLAFNAILSHRGVRTLCEEGWTPTASILNRTLLDIFANCVAVVKEPATADYMGFKYLSHFYRTWLVDPQITHPERDEATAALGVMEQKLQPVDRTKSQQLLAEPTPKVYWFQPEYRSVKEILSLSSISIYELYRLHSGPAHGGFASKLLFDDDPHFEDIEPRGHPKNTRKAIMASTRLLIEVCYIRDHWDNAGSNDCEYKQFLTRINQLPL